MGGGGGILSPITNTLFGKPPSAPPPPDYTGAARETAAGNLAAAQSATAANRVNQITPYGNLNYYESGRDSQGNPTWTAVTSLSGVGQELLNNQNQTSLGLGSAINAQLGQVQDVMGRGFNPNLPAIQYGGQNPQLSQVGQAEQQQRVGNAPQFQSLETANALRRAGNTDALQRSLGQNIGMEGWDRASNLLMSRLNPQIEQGQDRLRAQLANQGISAGTKAYNRAMTQQGQKENDLLTQAQLQAQGIQQNLFGQELQAGQFGNQATTQQQQNLLQNLGFSNQAQQQDYANRQSQLAFNNQMCQQGFANQLAGTQANNQAAQQNFANQLAGSGFNNQAAQQMFANQMAGANLSNQAQQQAYNQALTQYNMPLNTLSSLRTGAQVQNPSFINAPQQATTSGADILGATGMNFNAQMGNYNAQAAERNNMMQGLFSLGGAAMMSDIRTKENIKQIHWMPNGLPVYEYEYKAEFKDHPLAGHGKFVGVMAQEAELVKPEAVITSVDGYKMVNYGVLNG